jgi:hypothetical protein
MYIRSKLASKRAVLFTAAALLATSGFLFMTTSPESAVAAAGNTDRKDTVSPAATFIGSNVGAIPDGTSPCWNPGVGPPRNVTFDATGLNGAPASVSVSMTFGSPNHSFMGDVTAVLIAPNGASHTIFGRTLATTATAFGDSSDLAGPYIFSDTAPAPPNGGWWQASNAAGAAVPMPTGTYPTTNSGGAGAVNPMPPTSINAAFSGVANPNGTWTLRLTDGCQADTGAISAASLTIEAGTSGSGDANADFDGDGKTDFALARGTDTPLSEDAAQFTGLNRYPNPGLDERKGRANGIEKTDNSALAPPIYWYVANSGSNNTVSYFQNGDAATDFITPEDFDGDGKDDIVVWTEAPATQAAFKILQSSTNTVRVDFFGQTGDDPAIVGDYDGDGKADPAVYRCPPFDAADGQCFFFYRGSLNNPQGNITYVPWGFGVEGDFFPLIGDFDGDGKYDFNIQRSNPTSPANGQFVLLRSSDNGVEWINWGSSSDFLIPGDYDGDGKHDIMVRRTVSGVRQHWLLTRTGQTSMTTWGITGDTSAPGDYDGDGKTDLAIWRGSSTPGQSRFWVLRSSDLSAQTFQFGLCPTIATCDFAVAGWAVH